MIQSLQVRSSASADHARRQFEIDVLRGLARHPKQLSAKYFYDRRGSVLFDAICELDEYYVTRTELKIMRGNTAAIAASLPSEGVLIEFGSGSSVKTRLLLDQLPSLKAYVPIDISGEHLLATAYGLRRRYRPLILPVVADFTARFPLPALPEQAPRTVYFPGSTIGNFEHRETKAILHRIADLVGPGGRLLIGIDLQKDSAVIEAAYNDRAGVTAEFNLNLLHRINAELDGDFQVDGFAHEAAYDSTAGRIEMRLRCTESQTVHIAGKRFDFQRGEAIHTEYSHKYTVPGFAAMAAEAGFRLTNRWLDDRRYCAVLLLESQAAPAR